MSALKVNDSFPEGISFSFIPVTPETLEVTSCGIPQKYEASKEFQNKKVVLVSVPGAFTPTCQANHIPSFIKNIAALKEKGIDQVVVIGYNDCFVMSAWAKVNYTTDDFIVFASDDGASFSQKLGWTLGERCGRYAIVVDNGKVVYAENEPAGGVTVSGAEAVLAKL